MGKAIYETRDLETASQEVLDRIDKAVLAAAFKFRDQARLVFIQDGDIYKKHDATRFNKLAEGIMVGRLRANHQTVVHALGDNQDQHLWKTRFFVGGTVPRMNRGMIEKLDSINKAVDGDQQLLESYIKNAINNV